MNSTFSSDDIYIYNNAEGDFYIDIFDKTYWIDDRDINELIEYLKKDDGDLALDKIYSYKFNNECYFRGNNSSEESFLCSGEVNELITFLSAKLKG